MTGRRVASDWRGSQPMAFQDQAGLGGKPRRDSSEAVGIRMSEGEDARTSDREHGIRQARRRVWENGDEER